MESLTLSVSVLNPHSFPLPFEHFQLCVGNAVKGLQTLEGWLDKRTVLVSPNYKICNSLFLTRNLVTEKYHVQPALKTEEESKLLVSISKEEVFLD